MLCIIKQVFFMVVIFERRKNAGGCRKARIISLLHILLLNTKVAMVLSFRNVLIKYTQQGQSMTFLFNAIIALCIHRNIPCRVCVLSIGKSLGKCDVLIIFQSSYPSQIRVRIIMQCCTGNFWWRDINCGWRYERKSLSECSKEFKHLNSKFCSLII